MSAESVQTTVAIMVATSLLTTFLLALAIAISAKPVPDSERKSPIKLPLTKRIGLANHHVVEQDRRRVKSLVRYAIRDDSEPITTEALSLTAYYGADIGIGNPPTYYDLAIDSGSSLIWLRNETTYMQTRTNTSQQTNNKMFESYASGNFSGNEFIDQVTIQPGSGLVINSQSIGVASEVNGIEGMSGMLGIGPTDLTLGVLSSDQGKTIPTVTDSLYALGLIDYSVAVAFGPFNKSNSNNPGDIIRSGVLSWGGIDPSLFIGEIAYAPITKNSPANSYWCIDLTVSYLHFPLITNGAGHFDTGTTLVYLATNAYNAYKVLTGAVLDTHTNFLTVRRDQFDQMKDLSFIFSGANFSLTPDAQIWPQYLNTLLPGGVASQIYLIVQDLGPVGDMFTGGQSLIFGMTAFERFYCVFDTANKRIGLGNTPYTDAKLNLI